MNKGMNKRMSINKHQKDEQKNFLRWQNFPMVGLFGKIIEQVTISNLLTCNFSEVCG